jgi:hypothetical protein
MLAEQQNFCGRRDRLNSPGHFQPVDVRQANVQEDHIRLQLSGSADRFRPTDAFADKSKFRARTQQGRQGVPDCFIVVYEKNANFLKGQLSCAPSRLKRAIAQAVYSECSASYVVAGSRITQEHKGAASLRITLFLSCVTQERARFTRSICSYRDLSKQYLPDSKLSSMFARGG